MSGIEYSRWRFTTHLPEACRYTQSHCWLRRAGPGLWRAGLTPFALWLLGDAVEYEIPATPGSALVAGQEIGWIEGLKSVQTLDAVIEGVFLARNEALLADITLLERDPFQNGWLYCVRGSPSPGTLNVMEYAALLDSAVDTVKLAREAECEGECDA